MHVPYQKRRVDKFMEDEATHKDADVVHPVLATVSFCTSVAGKVGFPRDTGR